jgi:hypothetical protein
LADKPTFFQAHRGGITLVWARDSRLWWHEHYLATHGVEPPEGWWRDNSAHSSDGVLTRIGGQVEPRLMREFGHFDNAVMDRYFLEMENRYRAENGMPARGEGWVSQTHLARCVEEALPGVEVIREGSPGWLGNQRLDIYVPSMFLAIEYQGEQHYVAFAHFGGEEGFRHRQELDRRKREACESAGVRLLEWPFDSPISVHAVRALLGLAPS